MALAMVAREEVYARTWFPKTSVTRAPEVMDHYFGQYTEYGDIPSQAFLTRATNRTIGAHCHGADQFQILFGTPGAFYQRHAVPPIMLHYADAYTTYGPLGGTDPPLEFFTLRAQEAHGILYMPADQDQLPYRGHRQVHVDLDRLSAEASLPAHETRTETLIAAHPDGLEALAVLAGPHAELPLSLAESSSGQFVYVADGTLLAGARSYGERSLGWQDSESTPVRLIAGSSGCRVLVLRSPRVSTTANQVRDAS